MENGDYLDDGTGVQSKVLLAVKTRLVDSAKYASVPGCEGGDCCEGGAGKGPGGGQAPALWARWRRRKQAMHASPSPGAASRRI